MNILICVIYVSNKYIHKPSPYPNFFIHRYQIFQSEWLLKKNEFKGNAIFFEVFPFIFLSSKKRKHYSSISRFSLQCMQISEFSRGFALFFCINMSSAHFWDSQKKKKGKKWKICFTIDVWSNLIRFFFCKTWKVI